MILCIHRWKQSDKGTLGKFELIDEDHVLLKGSTIEREGPDTVESGKNKRIPDGIYKTAVHTSARFKTNLPLLYNDEVSKNRYILIHWGNSIKDLEGCIALGDSDNGEDFIYHSKKTVKQFLSLVEGHKLSITISSDYDNDRDSVDA